MKSKEDIEKEISIIKKEILIYKNTYNKQSDLSTAISINNNKIWIEALEWVLND